MNKEIKEDLVEALRSGKYVQGRHSLERADGSQCCLGVLCDILDAPFTAEQGGDKDYGGGVAFISHQIRNQAGLTIKETHMLMTMNDHGYTFDEIADYIEVSL